MEGEGPTSIDQPFALALTPKGAVARGMWRWVQPAVERATGLTELGLAYQRVRDAKSADEFLEAAVGELGVRWSANALDLARIPRSGPCIVVANHPFGAVEGIILTLMLRVFARTPRSWPTSCSSDCRRCAMHCSSSIHSGA